jgi:serine phosphatase RsbU (regulator of sigma subunit)
LRVKRGDRFFLYSDGLIESSAGGGRRAGLEQLVAACVRHRAAPLRQAVSLIARELRPEERPIEDDLLLLAADVGE